MKIKNPKLLTVLSILLIISISVLVYSLVYANKLPMIVEQINNGTIGVILTAIVTVFLLGQQSESEGVKERNSKVFEKKLEVYHEFIKALESIIQDGKISTINKDGEKDELTSLLFQLAQVRMHTGEEKVVQILERVAEINHKLIENNESTLDHKHLADCLFTIVNTLRWELYPEKEKSEISKTPKGLKNDDKFKEHIGNIVNWAKDSSAVEEPKDLGSSNSEIITLSNGSRLEVIKTFEDTIVQELKKRLTEDNWIIVSENSDRIHVTIKNKKWAENTKVGIYDYPDADRLCFATWYNGKGFYKDVYLMIRRDFAGRYNRYNWWLNLKEPYNKWDENTIGLTEVKENNEELIKYIIDSLVRVAIRFNEIVPVYDTICELKIGIKFSDKVTQGIYEAYSLIHIIDINGNLIGSDTFIDDNNKWELQLYGRNEGSHSFLQNEIFKSGNFPVPPKLTENKERFIFDQFDADADIALVRTSLQDLLNKLEAFIQRT